MAEIKNLSLATTIKVEGTDKTVTVDFSDKRLVLRVAKLLKKYNNIDEEINKRVTECEAIEDELDRFIALSEATVSILEEFKNDVNAAFNADITGTLFGDCVPDIERYFPFLEAITPYIQESLKEQGEVIQTVNKKYSLGRIKGNLAQAPKSNVVDFDFNS